MPGGCPIGRMENPYNKRQKRKVSEDAQTDAQTAVDNDAINIEPAADVFANLDIDGDEPVDADDDEQYFQSGGDMGVQQQYIEAIQLRLRDELGTRNKELNGPNNDQAAVDWLRYVDGTNIMPKLPSRIRTHDEAWSKNVWRIDALAGMGTIILEIIVTIVQYILLVLSILQ